VRLDWSFGFQWDALSREGRENGTGDSLSYLPQRELDFAERRSNDKMLGRNIDTTA
jgi:hypothetical protein